MYCNGLFASQNKKISLNFQHIEKRAVLQLLAEFSGVNMVVSDNVKGSMTLRLNHLPWEQALNIILSTQGLEQRKSGNIIIIDTKEHHFKQKQKMQKLEPIQSVLLKINYAKAYELANLIKDKNSSLLSKRGQLSVDKRTNTLWIQETHSKLLGIKRLIHQLDSPVQQVLIEARIVEMSKDFGHDLGIRWGLSSSSRLSGSLEGANQLAQGTVVSSIPLTQRLNLDLAAVPTHLSNPATLGIALAKLGNGILLDLELSALESEGRAELISKPRVITTNQQAALIESGEEIPYQETASSGATAVSFKKAVLSLKVTPQIIPNGKILLNLQIHQDTPSLEKFNGVPAVFTKQIKTNVLVNDNQTIVLGGIYKQDKNKTINRIPFFGELPIVGVLFQNKQIYLKNEELLIFITPRIITNIKSVKERT